MPKTPENPIFFTIITVVKDDLAGLKNTSESIKEQSCKDFDWIVIDGASSDGTPEFLENTTAKWISEPDDGLYDAMNKGLSRARGNYILFLNADDLLANQNVLKMIKTQAQNQVIIYGDSIEELQNNQRVFKPAKDVRTIKTGLFTHHQAIFYRRDKLDKLQYNTDYKIAADYDLTLRFLQNKPSILKIKAPICIFKAGGLSQQKAALGRKEQFQSRKEAKAISPWQNMLIYIAQFCIWHFRCALPALYWRFKSSSKNK